MVWGVSVTGAADGLRRQMYRPALVSHSSYPAGMTGADWAVFSVDFELFFTLVFRVNSIHLTEASDNSRHQNGSQEAN